MDISHKDIFLRHEFAAADPTDRPVGDQEHKFNPLNGQVVDDHTVNNFVKQNRSSLLSPLRKASTPTHQAYQKH